MRMRSMRQSAPCLRANNSNLPSLTCFNCAFSITISSAGSSISRPPATGTPRAGAASGKVSCLKRASSLPPSRSRQTISPPCISSLSNVACQVSRCVQALRFRLLKRRPRKSSVFTFRCTPLKGNADAPFSFAGIRLRQASASSLSNSPSTQTPSLVGVGAAAPPSMTVPFSTMAASPSVSRSKCTDKARPRLRSKAS